jgi:ADP-ribosylglycohydrolase
VTVLSSRPEDRLERARESLEGLSVGDAFGVLHGNRKVPLVAPPWRFTDDTNMACSIYSILRQLGEIDQDILAESFAIQYRQGMGYGPAMHGYLAKIRSGGSWQELALTLFGGMGSFGNGSAMRVAPLGAYFADDLNRAAEEAAKSAEVTHAHIEGIAGAVAVAVAAGLAASLRGQDTPTRAELINTVIPYIPDSEVRARCIHARDLASGATLPLAVAALGNGSLITCQDTVPYVLWCAGEYLFDYEEALWVTASGGGDRDTTCAMVGGIVAAYNGIEGIPAEWLKRREPLPNWALYDESYQQPA